MSERKTRDPVNQDTIEFNEKYGNTRLGVLKSLEWHTDPKRFMFSQSRYKFVAKMLSGAQNVLEVGCGDAFNAPLILQEVENLTVTDFDEEFIRDARERMVDAWAYDARVHNFIDAPMDAQFDAAYTLDVLEHIDQSLEHTFLSNICQSLTDKAVMVVGIPSLESQIYASAGSKLGHINCKTAPDLKATMQHYFHSVFMFSMNDEVVHTGFHKMSHYLLAVCAHRKL